MYGTVRVPPQPSPNQSELAQPFQPTQTILRNNPRQDRCENLSILKVAIPCLIVAIGLAFVAVYGISMENSGIITFISIICVVLGGASLCGIFSVILSLRLERITEQTNQGPINV